MAAPNELVNLLDVLTTGRTLPEGCDTWGLKSVRPDGRTSRGYRWPLGPAVVESPGPHLPHNGACPADVGDGLCVAWSWRGMASGGIPARTLLLLAWAQADVLGVDNEEGKARVRRVHVVDVIDGERLVRNHGARADLAYADLTGTNLAAADLTQARLAYADLTGTNLECATLTNADLTGTNLGCTTLANANLAGTNLTQASLVYAILTGTTLTGADLTGATMPDGTTHL